MKKVLSLVLVLAMVCGLAGNAFAADYSVDTDADVILAGEDVTVSVTLDETLPADLGTYMVQIELYYDAEVLTVNEEACVVGESYSSLLSVNQMPGCVQCIYLDFFGIGAEFPAGTLLTAVFTANEDISAEAVEAAFEVTLGTADNEGEHSDVRNVSVMVCPGHEWDWGVESDHTCDQDYVITYTCYNCGATKTEEAAATGHVASSWPSQEYQEDGTILVTDVCQYCYEPMGEPVLFYQLYSDECPATTAEVAAGECINYMAYGFGGYTLTVTGENVTVDVSSSNWMTGETIVETYEPVDGVVSIPVAGMSAEITIHNNGTTAATYVIGVVIPEGDYQNPVVLTDGENTVEIPADNYYGYFTSYTPVCDGTVTVTVSGEYWDFQANYYGDPDDWSDDVYGDYHNHADDPVVNTETLKVKAGFPVEVNLSNYYIDADWNWVYPAGTITVNVEFVPEHTIIHAEAKEPTCYEEGNIEHWYCETCGYAWLDADCTMNTNLMAVILPVTHSIEHVEAKDPTCLDDGNIEYWYCTECGFAWLDEYLHLNTNLMAVVLPHLDHVIEHVEAKEATCLDDGNIEYWYCTVCGFAWLDEDCTKNTNLMAVVLPRVEHTIEHVEAKDATCLDDGNIEYWYCTECGFAWLDEACTKNTNLKAVVLPHLDHVVEHVEAKDATCLDDGNIEYWYCTSCGYAWLDEACTKNTNLKAVVLPHLDHVVEHVEAKDPTCLDDGNIEYWYCTNCGYAWLDEACTKNTNLKAVVLPHVEHTIEHVEAKEATCYEEGNIEYWYCTECGYAWADEELTKVTNLKSVILPIVHSIEHVEAVEADCWENGNVEYWYCTDCGYAWLDENLYQVTNLLSVVTPATGHTVEHVEAKEATCFEPGNIEYWYCTDCGYAWLDEACTKNTNLKAVVLPITHDVTHVEAKDATCTANGNIEYWYCEDCGYAWLDEYCTKNTNQKAVVLPKLDHVDADKNNVCDNCKADLSSAQTGDSSMVHVMIAVCVISLAAIVALPVAKKKFF